MDSRTSDKLDVALDILGQQPLLRIYTQLSFCFGHAEDVPDESIISTLTQGLEKLSESFPWVAGQVVNEGAGQGTSGIFKIKPFTKTPRLVVKDLRNDVSVPTMSNLRSAEFPMSMLDEDVIAPRRTLPGGPGSSPTDPEPVLILQANFIVGGLILTLNGQHAAMDMTGQGEVIRLLHESCRGVEFTPEEMSANNLTRDTVIPLLDNSYTPGSELDDQLISSPPSTAGDRDAPQQPSHPPKASWVIFSFNPKSLETLKAQASESRGPGCAFVSTDDALSAFIWQHASQARFFRLSSSTACTMTRAVDLRPYFDVPKTYPGLLQNLTYNKSTFQQLRAAPLGVIAAGLRSRLEPQELRFRSQALVTHMSRTADKTLFSFTAKVDPSVDFMLSSWAKVPCYSLDFHLGLGPPESVRRPRFTPLEGLMYLLPKATNGEIAAAISLRDDDLERLKKDEEFIRFAKFIG